MKHVFIDTNVAIDLLMDREGFADDAEAIFTAAEAGECVVYMCSLSLTNIFYIVSKQMGRQVALDDLRVLNRLVNVTPVTSAEINQALYSDFSDFEDAVQYFSALSVPRMDGIITRNPKDFRLSILPVITPKEFVAGLQDK